MTSELVALLDGREIGRVNRDARGRIRFVYDDEWRKAADAYPLSLSMPLGAKEHGRAVTEAFLWGLLPDHERVLVRWAAKFQVSALAIPSFFEIKESKGVRMLSEKNQISVFRSPRCFQT